MDDNITSPIIIVKFSEIMYYVYNKFKNLSIFFYVVIFVNKVQFFLIHPFSRKMLYNQNNFIKV